MLERGVSFLLSGQFFSTCAAPRQDTAFAPETLGQVVWCRTQAHWKGQS